MSAAPTPEQFAALMVLAASASPEAVAEADEFETDIPPPEMDDFELAEAAEAGVYIPSLLDEIRRRASLLTDDELLSVEPFEGDDSDVRVLSSKVVRGRREHRDHWSAMPIPAGEPHVVRKELFEGEFLTTRHSRETLWMALAGGFGSQELAKQVAA